MTGRGAAFSAEASSQSIPWYLWSAVLATVCISGGLYWDISWHMTIGRDTFWTPAHLLIQFGAILAGFSAAWIIFRTTFAGDAEAKESSVKIMGLLGPLGAFICAWGAATMVISAPFDNWWHNAYGLDVKIISPPHQVLGFGIEAIGVGGVILIAGSMNRAEGTLRRRLQLLLLALGGFIMTHDMMGVLEYTDRSFMHSGVMYLALSLGPLFILETFGRASGVRWGRTAIAGVYTVLFVLAEWIFPLFAAEPKLGPVYQRVTQMVPLGFPLLLVVPAFALDFIWPKLSALQPQPGFWNKWFQAAVAGMVYVAVFMAVQWPFGNFLMTPAARNWIFGTQLEAYMVPPDWFGVRNLFWPGELHFWRNLGLAYCAATIVTRLGMMLGSWVKKVQR